MLPNPCLGDDSRSAAAVAGCPSLPAPRHHRPHKVNSIFLPNVATAPVLSTTYSLPMLPWPLTPSHRHHHSRQIPSRVGQFSFPEKSVFFTNISFIQTDPAHWDRPTDFWPDRFLSTDGR